ncbi:dephospho-CoA kinase [Sediminibacillus massiliensis]|uniref:dephospho-CoA kinase n=1 Tax=Sediminibacillus massiliensis TaxID=1926277 RepID=UPI00098878AE|nr:dephospho-CoA kinase [Sediminibacillus massiliensis]
MAVVIGLTGSIASGKSTVSTMFEKLNIPVVDADKLSRVVVEPGEEAYRKIVHAFGEDILLEDKQINREKLGRLIFSDKMKRQKLNEIVHPAVRKEMIAEKERYLSQGEKAVVLDIPLLFESNLAHFADKTIVVFVDQEVQIDRLMKRNNFTREEAMDRINSQMSLSEKVKLADEVIDNNGSIENSYEQLLHILKNWGIF